MTRHSLTRASMATTTTARVDARGAFFERLHALAPARRRDEDDDARPRGRFARAPSARAAARLQRKTTKRAALTPRGRDAGDELDDDDGASDSEASAEDGGAEADGRGGDDDDEDEDARARWSFERRSEDKLEALRERLRKKIESSRTARRAVETAETARDAKEWRERRNEAKREKKRKERANATLTEARRGEKRAKGVDGEAKGGMGAGGGGASDMAFGRITTDDVALNSGRKKKKESKEALLRKVQARQKAIDDAGGEEGGGKAVAEKFAWEAALSRASGEKVLDDPKLLQKSIKREARAKKKSREKWEERTAKVKEQMDAAQTKRKSNIKARKDGKMERKMDKASNKRNRPGFEGRSDGFINK